MNVVIWWKKSISSLYISEFCHIGEKRTSFWKRQIVFVFYSSDQRPARVFTGFYSVIKIKKQALAAFKRYNPTAVVLLALCYILYLLHIYSVVFELRISRHLPPTLTILLFHGITQESGTINKVVQVFLSILQMGCIWIFFMHNAFRVHWLDAHMVKRGTYIPF